MGDEHSYSGGCNHRDCLAARIASLQIGQFLFRDEVVRDMIGVIMAERDATFAEAVVFALLPLRALFSEIFLKEVTLEEDIDQAIAKLLAPGG